MAELRSWHRCHFLNSKQDNPYFKDPQKERQLMAYSLRGHVSVTVTVGAGREGNVWKLPKTLLTHISPFFNRNLNREMTTASTTSIALKEEDPVVFELFVFWIYASMVNVKHGQPVPISRSHGASICTQAWILGQKLECPRFQDFAMANLVICTMDQANVANFVRVVYAKTQPEAKLRIHAANLVFTHMLGLGVEEMRTDELFKLVEEIHGLSSDMFILDKMKSTRKWDDTALFFLVSGPENFVLTC
ncbi:MAG: hypothetical protein Q9208_000542 [Pyrenodesmia sp. 3 TL-2023]